MGDVLFSCASCGAVERDSVRKNNKGRCAVCKSMAKVYYCPVCGWETVSSTNHYLEIYSGCKNCKSGVLYRKGRLSTDQMPDSRIRVETYRLDTSKENEAEMYKVLKDNLKGQGYKKVLDNGMMKKTGIILESLAQRQVIEVFDKNYFKEQYKTSAGRLHNWVEFKYDNKSIKAGYYIAEWLI